MRRICHSRVNSPSWGTTQGLTLSDEDSYGNDKLSFQRQSARLISCRIFRFGQPHAKILLDKLIAIPYTLHTLHLYKLLLPHQSPYHASSLHPSDIPIIPAHNQEQNEISTRKKIITRIFADLFVSFYPYSSCQFPSDRRSDPKLQFAIFTMEKEFTR